jgi:homoserine O-succinyltransferase
MKLRLAILDLYDGEPNLGMDSIIGMVQRYEDQIDWQRFDVRQKAEVPKVEDFDLFISSGGPGSPLDGDGVWDKRYYRWIDELFEYNAYHEEGKKYAFFICHSFQMICHHLQVGLVTPRNSQSFGTFPAHPTDAALEDPIFKLLPNPFYIADFRDWQVIQPDVDRLESLGAEILALEKIRPHVPYERAIMAIRFSPEIIGVQFHPEADADGMLKHFRKEERLIAIFNKYGKQKYAQMIKDLSHPYKIQLTHEVVIPSFLEQSMRKLTQRMVPSV